MRFAPVQHASPQFAYQSLFHNWHFVERGLTA